MTLEMKTTRPDVTPEVARTITDQAGFYRAASDQKSGRPHPLDGVPMERCVCWDPCDLDCLPHPHLEHGSCTERFCGCDTLTF